MLAAYGTQKENNGIFVDLCYVLGFNHQTSKYFFAISQLYMQIGWCANYGCQEIDR